MLAPEPEKHAALMTNDTALTQRSIVITGASKGLGAALAERYAAPNVRLGIVARDSVALANVAARCEARGAVVDVLVADVTDKDHLVSLLCEFDTAYPIDLLITNAGITAASHADGSPEDLPTCHRLLDINLLGTINTVQPIAERMRLRSKGQIAMVSSLAAFYGMPITPIYCASKAALKSYGEALRGLLAPQGVKVNVICPGFMKTDLSDLFPGPRPFMLSTEQAARIIVRDLERNRAFIAFPKLLAWGMKSLQWLPFPLASFFMGLSGYNRAQMKKPS